MQSFRGNFGSAADGFAVKPALHATYLNPILAEAGVAQVICGKIDQVFDRFKQEGPTDQRQLVAVPRELHSC